MEILFISFIAFIASILTFFSGFGLGTILMPVFAIFFPVEIAIALTGIVHLLNNLFKISIVGKYASWKIVLQFGLPAIIGALIGAGILIYFSNNSILASYQLGNIECEITPIKLIISIIILFFAILELLPFFQNLEFSKNKLLAGGLISGFFGGLSGHQGALRSAFLIKCGLTKESFIATGVIIASIVDVSRISIYFTKYTQFDIENNALLLISAVIAAFFGAILGRQLLKKVTIKQVNIIVTIMLILLSTLMGLGII